MSLVSVVIPARNEAENIVPTVSAIVKEFQKNKMAYEIVVVNDGSTDNTGKVVRQLAQKDSGIRLVRNRPPHGFGNAIKKGLEVFKGDYVIIAMADASDKPKDMVRYVKKMKKGYDCCFGSRWCRQAVVKGYPRHKYILNRIFNVFIMVLFGLRYNDVTNAFKAYSRETIKGIQPILAHHFNITVELPLKAIVRGYSYAIIPTDWRERKIGTTSLKIQEMGSRYLFIIMYAFLEKLLCAKDYRKIKEETKAE